MTKKIELARQIIQILIEEQRNPAHVAKSPFNSAPFGLQAQLPTGEGGYLPATPEALILIASYVALIKDNDEKLLVSHSDRELVKLVETAFGSAFASVDIHQPDENIHEQTISILDIKLTQVLEIYNYEEEIAFGCWALTGPGTNELDIGPVKIEDRYTWLIRHESSGRLSSIVTRRVRKRWSGINLRARKSSFDIGDERAIIDTIGECNSVCSVSTSGLSQNVAERKALIVAHLALTTLSLAWQTPSLALNRMGLLVDGPIHRKHTVSFASTHMSRQSSSISGLGGQFVTADWVTVWPSLGWLVGPIGEALYSYVRPNRPILQPKVINALFMSLWWFHQACREGAAIMAIVKFAASLDALAGGGKARGIVELIEARLQLTPGAALTTDGRTATEIVKVIYGDARSRAIHGSTNQHGHDWEYFRQLSEAIAKLCLNLSCDWISQNPNSDELKLLRQRQ